MITRRLAIATTCLAIVAFATGPGPLRADDETPEQRFERLLAPALKEPEKADWKELRAAFAGTAAHEPYNTEITRELRRVVGQIGKVDAGESEAALVKIVERERYMRLDSVFMLMQFCEKHDQPERAAQLKKIVDAIIIALDYPRGGTSLEKAVTVLYIDEEYLFLRGAKSGGQRHMMQDGHHYDVLVAPATDDAPEHSLYFNVDLVWRGNPVLKELRAKGKGTKPD